MQKVILLFLTLFSFSIFAQNGPTNPPNSRSNSIANAAVALNDINSLFNNQAGLANLKNLSVIWSAQETFRSPFSNNSGGGFAIPVSSGTFGLNYHNFGSSDFKQLKFGLAYARNILKTLSFGIQFDLLSTQIPLNERSNLLTFELGLQYKLSKKLLLGIHLYNPTKLEIVKDEFLPTILRLGASYSLNKKIFIHAELKKDFMFPIVYKNGIEFELIHDLWFRIGFQVKPTTINFGLGYLFKKGFRFDLAAFYQQGLNLNSSGPLASSGFVPSIGIGYDILKN